MKIYPIHTGNFKLDGGAMFGVVPKSIWSRTNEPDGNNMCTWSMRCLLIEDGNRLMLVDTGIGDKQSDKFFGYYFLHGDLGFDHALEKLGFHRDDITDVFLTHLHFDHSGGAIEWNDEKSGYRPAFKNANYWSNEAHWEWATKPNKREKASFLKENINPIEESGQLNHIVRPSEGRIVSNGFYDMDVVFVDGHTDAQMLPVFNYKGHKLVYMADLLPSVGHIPLPYVMGYDTRPLLTLDEKEWFLNKAADENIVMLLEHDHLHECCTVKHTDRGVRLDQTFQISDL